jgi:hypothetical protein
MPFHLDKILAFFVISMIVMFCAQPILLTIGWLFANNTISKIAELHLSTLENQINYTGGEGGIMTDGTPQEMISLARKLQMVTASRGDASLQTRRLHIVLVEIFDSKKNSAHYDYGFWRLRASFHNAGDASVLAVSNAPVLWDLADSRDEQRARIAFEGNAPVKTRDSPAGFVAGFRIASFGSDNTTIPAHLVGLTIEQNKKQFCDATDLWKKFFKVDSQNIIIWRTRNPTKIAVDGSRILGNADAISKLGSYSDICQL